MAGDRDWMGVELRDLGIAGSVEPAERPRAARAASVPPSRAERPVTRTDAEVIEPDSRTRVKTTAVPYRWICSLRATLVHPDDSTREIEKDEGSGLLIGSRWVLTAAHLVYAQVMSRSGKSLWQEARRIVVMPGRDGSKTPFGQASSVALAYPDEWRDRHDDRFDYALIKLDTEIGKKKFKVLGNAMLGWWDSKQMQELGDDRLENRIVNVSGYPNEKRHEQWAGFAPVRDVIPRLSGVAAPELISHLVDTTMGQSGAPVYLYYPTSRSRHLVGVHKGGCGANWDGCVQDGRPSYNLAVRLRKAVVDQIAQWKSTL